jgi:hypothetical protein
MPDEPGVGVGAASSRVGLTGESLRAIREMQASLDAVLNPGKRLRQQLDETFGALRQLQNTYGVGSEIRRMEENRKRLLASFTRNAIPDDFQIGSAVRAAHQAISAFRSDVGGAAAALALLRQGGAPASIAEHIRRLAEPYGGFRQISELRDMSISPAFEAAKTLRELKLPVIEIEAAAAVSVGLDPQALLDAFSPEEASNDDVCAGSDPDGVSLTRRIPALDFWNAVNLLLTILLAFYADYSSQTAEKRLSGKIEAAHEIQRRQLLQVEGLLLELLRRSEDVDAPSSGCLQALHRPAHVRDVYTGGRIGVVLPNQLVRQTARRGKWALIEYFDFGRQQRQEGWVLKKYFARAPSCKVPPSEILT